MITIQNKTYDRAYTHAGKFHADDVCCAALLRILDPLFPIERGFAPPKDENTLVFDIGNGEFDHHKEPKELREDGFPYASFGKLWRALGDQFGLNQKWIQKFDTDIVRWIDRSDNTGIKNAFSELIASMNPCWNMKQDADEPFFQTVAICQQLFLAFFVHAKADMYAADVAKHMIDDSIAGIAIADQYIPSSAFPDGTYFFVCPSVRGGWQAMSIKQGARNSQIFFPADWRGKVECLPDGMTFCHSAGFLATFKTKAQAISTCKKLIDGYRSCSGF